MKRIIITIFLLSFFMGTASAGILEDVQSGIASIQNAAKKLVIFEYNVRGSIGGLPVSVIAITDSQAVVDFDNYGRITFDSSGLGENENIKVQLNPQYGRYFCTVDMCGGMNAWVSDSATITWKVEKPRSYNKLTSLGNGYYNIDACDSAGYCTYRNPTWDTSGRDRTQDAINGALGYTELIITSSVYNQHKTAIDNYIITNKRTDIYLDNFHNVIYYQVAPQTTIPAPTYKPTPQPTYQPGVTPAYTTAQPTVAATTKPTTTVQPTTGTKIIPKGVAQLIGIKETPGFEAVYTIAGILTISLLFMRQRRN